MLEDPDLQELRGKLKFRKALPYEGENYFKKDWVASIIKGKKSLPLFAEGRLMPEEIATKRAISGYKINCRKQEKINPNDK